MDLIPKRREQIAKAVFDRFVMKHIIEADENFTGDVNLRFLNNLAKQLGCNVRALELSIGKSCGRIGHVSVQHNLPKTEEAKVMMAAAKYYIKGIEVPLKNYKREFGNVTAELNNQDPDLHLKTKELLTYAFPIYWEIMEEIFEC